MGDEAKAANSQFGQPLIKSDEGVSELGRGRTAAGRSRFVDDDEGVHAEFALPVDDPPPPQQASGAAEAQSGQIDEDYPEFERNREALKQVPPGPSAWEAGIPDEE